MGQSVNGLGGEFIGGEAPLRLVPSATTGAPKTGTHHKGELYVDSNFDLFYCKADGTPGTWKGDDAVAKSRWQPPAYGGCHLVAPERRPQASELA